jgi:NAD(P)-dependent dehydrogenase (short-subunit alcohol dehydrogenase family)
VSHALIIGGTRGAGRTAARMFRAEGYDVSAIARRLPAKREAIEGVRYATADASVRSRLRKALKKVCAEGGKIDCVAFFQRFRPPGDPWTDELAISLTGLKSVIESLVEDFDLRDCSIVVVSSVNSSLVSKDRSVGYHAAKAGLNQMVRYYAVVLGDRGIRVNSVSPGTFIKEEAREYYRNERNVTALYGRITPLGRMAGVEEVIRPMLFLSGAGASFITGQDLVVDGGLSAVLPEALARELAPSRRTARS